MKIWVVLQVAPIAVVVEVTVERISISTGSKIKSIGRSR